MNRAKGAVVTSVFILFALSIMPAAVLAAGHLGTPPAVTPATAGLSRAEISKLK